MQDSIKADVGWLNDIPIVFKLSDQVLERLKLTPINIGKSHVRETI